MLTRFAGVLAVAAAVGLAACGGNGSSQEFGKPDVDQIRKMIQDFVTAYNAKDVEKVGSFFADTAALMPANRSILRGVELVRGYYQGRFTEDGATDLIVEAQTVDGHGPLGYVAATFSLNLRPPDGSAPRHDRGKVLWIVRKLGGQWKFEYQIMSSDLPAVLPALK
jgi:uncharacterized protein (TIGR02246 family)